MNKKIVTLGTVTGSILVAGILVFIIWAVADQISTSDPSAFATQGTIQDQNSRIGQIDIRGGGAQTERIFFSQTPVDVLLSLTYGNSFCCPAPPSDTLTLTINQVTTLTSPNTLTYSFTALANRDSDSQSFFLTGVTAIDITAGANIPSSFVNKMRVDYLIDVFPPASPAPTNLSMKP